jgi:hypothetical protein
LLHELALEVLHSEFHAPQLQHVELLDLVVLTSHECHGHPNAYIFPQLVLEGADHEPEAVDTVLFEFVTILRMVNVKGGGVA